MKSRRNLRCADVQGPTGPILRSQEPKAQGSLAKAEAKVSLCASLAIASTILVDRLRFLMAMLESGLSRVAPFVFALSNLASFFQHTPILDAGKTLAIVLYPRSMDLTLGSEETTELVPTRSTNATKSLVKSTWFSSLSSTRDGALLPRTS